MVCASLRVKYTASFAAMLDRNVYILCVHIDSSLYTPDYVQRANSWVSKESSGTQPQICTNESRQEPWLVARYLGKRWPVITSEIVVIENSSMPLYEIVGMAGRGHSPPDTDSSSVESPSVGCGRVGLGRMPTASDCQWGARNKPADLRRLAQTLKSQSPEIRYP